MPKNVLSFGAGVNSTAILALHKLGQYPLKAVIFADTRCERPETYEHIETTCKPYCASVNLPFHTVERGDLLEWFQQYHMIPVRMLRGCTEKFKIIPIKKFVQTHYPDATVVLGIDAGESHRARRYINKSNYAPFTFPLIDLNIDRKACKRLITSVGWTVPIKSGCYFCPFTRRKQWVDLLLRQPELFSLAEQLEKNSRHYPKYSITYKPLEEIRKSWESQQFLDNWIEVEGEPCVFCHL